MKSFLKIVMSVMAILVLTSQNIFACACCADEGYYKISVHKPSQYQIEELKKLQFYAPMLYTTVGFPDDVKGITPVSQEYKMAWFFDDFFRFKFEDELGNTGDLRLKKPKTFVDYAVDTRQGEKGSAGSAVLYKEWRFKFKVDEGTGIFESALKKTKAEYFLVLQGKGNACTSAADFSDWRLEITGKKANFAMYGKLGLGNNGQSIISKSLRQNRNTKVPYEFKADFGFVVGGLRGANYSGCGCFGKRVKKSADGRIFWIEQNPNREDEKLVINVDGKDMSLNLFQKGVRPGAPTIGSRFMDEYLTDGYKVILDYVLETLPSGDLNKTDYAITATIIGKFNGKVLLLEGSCGCPPKP